MKNSQLQFILNEIPEASKGLIGRKFSTALYKNIRKIEEELGDIRKLIEPSEKFQKIQQEIQAKKIELSDKLPNGNPKTKKVRLNDGRETTDVLITIKGNEERLDKFLKDLEKKNSETFKEYEAQVLEYNKALDDDCDIDFVKVDEDDLPDNISPTGIFTFEFMINFKK